MNFFNKILRYLVFVVCLIVSQSFGASPRPGFLSDALDFAGRAATAVGDTARAAKREIVDPLAGAVRDTAKAASEEMARRRAADEVKLQELMTNKVLLEQRIAKFEAALVNPDSFGERIEPLVCHPESGTVKEWREDHYYSSYHRDSHYGYGDTPKSYTYDEMSLRLDKAKMQAGLAGFDRMIHNLEETMRIKEENRLKDLAEGGTAAKVAEKLEKLIDKREEARGRVMVAREYGKAIKETLKETLLSFGTTQNVAILISAIIVLIAAYKGLSFAQMYFEAKLGRPSLVRESSKSGFKKKLYDFAKSVFSGDEDEVIEDILNNIILSKELESVVHTLADDARQTRELGLPYQNVLFYGPPGTGKTEFARILAQYSGMDFAILSGADFSQFKNGEGITELHKLFEWAKNSDKGLLIFIDEADAFLRDRALLDKDGVNLVNAFLSHTGCSSDKFMLVFATNYADELDAAVRSRIHKKFAFGLPANEERYKILMLKLKKYIFDDKRVFMQDGEEVEASLSVDPTLDEAYWRDVAGQVEGFSGRDIDQAVGEMRIRAYRSGMNMLTKDIVDFVIKSKIETIANDKRITEYQHMKFEQETGLHRDEAAAGLVPVGLK